MSDDPVRIAQFWQAVEIFSPRPLPDRDPRMFTVDIQPGEPMPWEPGSRRTLGPPGHGYVWRHAVYGGVFPLSRVREALAAAYGPGADDAAGYPPSAGDSALFACTVDDGGCLLGSSVPGVSLQVSECAWALGRVAKGASPLTDFTRDAARLAGDIRDLPDIRRGVKVLAAMAGTGESGAAEAGGSGVPLAGADLRRFTTELAVRLGVSGLLSPRGIRIRSYQVRAGTGAEDLRPSLNGVLNDDLERVKAALASNDAGLALTQFLTSDDEIDRNRRTDVRQHPLWVLDWCQPDLIPPGRWVTSAERPLVFSQQFAVNQIMRTLGAGLPGLFALNGPPGTGKTTVFRDLIAAIVVQRATELAALRDPADAFTDKTYQCGAAGECAAGGGGAGETAYRVTRLAPKLTGHEIVLAVKDAEAAARAAAEIPGPEGISPRWHDAADAVGYFAGAAPEVSGPGTWAPLAVSLGTGALGGPGDETRLRIVREMISAEGKRGKIPGWRAAVEDFRRALARVEDLATQRSVVARHIASLPDSVAGRDQAATAVRKAQAERDTLQARRQELDAERAELSERPGLMSVLSAGGRRDRRNRRETERALAEIDQQMAEWFEAETAADAEFESWDASARESRQAVDEARRRWGRRVPDGPEYAETQRQDLVDRRELSAPWADEEFCRARTELFLSALALHKAFILAEAPRIRSNLGALASMLYDGQRSAPREPGAVLAAWQTLFLVVPVVSVALPSFGTLLSGLGRESIGWVLTDDAGKAGPQEIAGALWRARRAVIAGDPLRGEPVSIVPWSGQRALLDEFRIGTEWAPGRASTQRVADRLAAAGTSIPDPSAPDPGGQVWTGTPLRLAFGGVLAVIPSQHQGQVPPARNPAI